MHEWERGGEGVGEGQEGRRRWGGGGGGGGGCHERLRTDRGPGGRG